MNKEEVLNILKDLGNTIDLMTDDQLFDHMLKSSKTFRTLIDQHGINQKYWSDVETKVALKELGFLKED